MKTINKGKRITSDDSGQQAEMSVELKALKISAAIEVLEVAIERSIRARYGLPVIG